MDWRPEFVDGNVRASCSICGCSRRAPDNLTLCSDKRWRCERCMEVSEYEVNQRLAGWRKRKPQPDTGFGLSPWDEVPQTFLAAAQSRQAQLIPGWTPASTFQDTFDVVPGGGGSLWTVTLIGAGAVSQPSAGVARFTSGTTVTGEARATVASVTVPAPGAGRFYCACSFKTVVIGANTTSMSVGTGIAAGTTRNVIGLRGVAAAGTAFYQLVAQAIGQSNSLVETDATTFHLGEVWWNSTGPVFGSVDGGPALVVPSAGAVSRLPLISVLNSVAGVTSSTLDVTDYVCFT